MSAAMHARPRRATMLCALVLLSLVAPTAREARSQAEPTTVTILRRTAVRVAPEAGATTVAFVNPGTFGVTQFRVQNAFVRLLLSEIDRRRPSSGYGFIDTADVAVDSATTSAARAPAEAPVPVLAAPQPPARKDTAVVARPAATVPARSVPAVPARTDTAPAPRTETVLRPMPSRAGELTVRPESPPPAPSGVDSPDLSFLKKGALAAIVQRPMSYQIGRTGDSIVVPAGFVAEFASIPRALWTELSPVGQQQRIAIVHDYLYWFQPCEREETDNLLMIAMTDARDSDLKRGAVYAGVRVGSADVWNANRVARERGDLKIVPTQVTPTAQESWADYRARLGRADIRGTPGPMPRQKYCDYGRSQQVP